MNEMLSRRAARVIAFAELSIQERLAFARRIEDAASFEDLSAADQRIILDAEKEAQYAR